MPESFTITRHSPIIANITNTEVENAMTKKHTKAVNKQRRAMLQGTLAGAAGGAAILLRPETRAADSDLVSPATAEHVAGGSQSGAGARRTVKGYISPLYALEFEVEDPKKK